MNSPQTQLPASTDELYQRSPNTVTRTIAGETFIVTIRKNVANMDRLFVLDEVSGFIWERFDGQHTLTEIAHKLTQEFEVELDQASHDVHTFAAELEEFDLLGAVKRV